MDLGGEAKARPGEDHGAHHQVVRERGVDSADRLHHVAHRRHVGLEVAVELGVGQLGEGLHLEALVLVAHVDGSRPPMSGRWIRDRARLGSMPGAVGAAVLAEQVDLVPERASARTRLAL